MTTSSMNNELPCNKMRLKKRRNKPHIQTQKHSPPITEMLIRTRPARVVKRNPSSMLVSGLENCPLRKMLARTQNPFTVASENTEPFHNC